jgi:hypothetical protein
VALTHDRRTCQQAAGERACLVRARAEIVERVEAVGDTRDRDPPFAIVQIVGNDEIVGDRVAAPERAERINSELGYAASPRCPPAI